MLKPTPTPCPTPRHARPRAIRAATVAVTLALTAVLAGCAGVPALPMMQPAVPAPAPVAAPVVAPPPATGFAGLQSREPDACHAANYRSAVGQPATVIPSLGVRGPSRVVEYRGIEPQEYNAQRVVFRLDQAGVITAVDCG